MPPSPLWVTRHALHRFRRPEYTGVNRCLPCTAVNLAIAALGVGVLWQFRPGVALLFAGLASATIALRGYLVPGTPALTRRFLPDAVLARFGQSRPAVGASLDDRSLDVLETLTTAGVLVEVDGDIALEPAFERRLVARVNTMDRATDTADIAALLGVPPERVTRSSGEETVIVRVDGRWAGQWESRVALLTDLAADRELAAVVADWDELSRTQQSSILGGLRASLTRCPVCRGDVELVPEVVESCCRSLDVVAATCRGCGARLFELEWTHDEER